MTNQERDYNPIHLFLRLVGLVAVVRNKQIWDRLGGINDDSGSGETLIEQLKSVPKSTEQKPPSVLTSVPRRI